jgi:FSR family fosmidomycin resistance protein-like MFS transporter
VHLVPLVLIIAGHLYVDMCQAMLPVLLPILKVAFRLSYTQVGIAAGLSAFMSSIIQPVFGWLSDRWRTEWFVPAGVAWSALAMGGLGFAPSFGAVLALLAAAGIGTAAFHPKASIGVARHAGSHRALAMSCFTAAGNAGWAIGPTVTLGLLAWLQLPGLTLVVPGGVGLGLLLARFAGRRPAAARAAVPAEPAGGARASGQLATLIALVSLRSWTYSGTTAFLPLALEARGIPVGVGGQYLSLFLLAGAVGSVIGGHLADRFGRRAVLVATHTLFVPCILLFLQGGAAGALRLALLAAAGASLLATFSLALVVAQEILPRRMGLASGLILGLSFGVGAVGTSVTGLLADLFGLPTAFVLQSLLPLGAAGLSLLLREPSAQTPDAAAGRGEPAGFGTGGARAGSRAGPRAPSSRAGQQASPEAETNPRTEF